MRAIVDVHGICIDNIDSFRKSAENDEGFEIMIYKSGKDVGVWLRSCFTEKDAIIMFDLSRKNAIFLGHALIGISKTVKRKNNKK